MRKISLSVLIFVLFAAQLRAQTYYVSTIGSDSSDGSFDHPFRTIPKGISLATVPGTTVYVRGGTYAYSTTITISRSGNSSNMYRLFAFPGERVFLDFSSMPISSSNRGIRLSGSYWYIKGFDIWKAGDNGMNVSGSNNIIEFCSFSENSDTGLQIGGGASNNQIINCDSYFNADPSNGNADGFAPKLDVGTGNYFYGCRSWQNSADGWDGYIRPRPAVVPTTTLENCWCFRNGYLKTGVASSGNGNGYKMGGSDSANLSHTMILKNCLSFQNRVKGFDQNNNHGSMTLLNCTSFSNGTNYGMNGPIDNGSVMTLKNCISAGTGAVNLPATAVLATNSWMSPFVVTNTDFVSVDTAGVRGPRNPDGSLPHLDFMRLAPGSDLIDAGTNVGLPYNGPAPDLGAFETDVPLPIQLLSFTGQLVQGNVVLTWVTLSETSCYGFNVQRKRMTDSLWTELPQSFTPGHGTTNETHTYSYTDSSVANGLWRYKLKCIDLNSTVSYTESITISIVTGVKETQPIAFRLYQNYPNPFNPETNIRFSVATTGNATLTVYNMLGQRLLTLFDNVAEVGQSYNVKFNGSVLAGGVYFYRLQSGQQTDLKKLTLLK